ncbi:MAG: ATP-binding protein, partial [Chloroflexi bacterium]|nr:ATP-binding protein [Chloroflexota bacterium]
MAGGGDANLERHHQLLPLGQHGGGLPHLLRMAGEFSRNHNAIILLEEPELGLNPELQRELIQQITNDTANQYIITTHSSVFMDAGLAESVYRIEYDGVRSKVHLCKTKGDLYTVLQFLGNRPS